MGWTIEKRLHVWAIGDGKGLLTYVETAPSFYDGEPCGMLTSRGRTAEELAAIARLIAAAPDLLELCQRSLAALRGESDCNDMAAIGLATDLECAIAIQLGV